MSPRVLINLLLALVTVMTGMLVGETMAVVVRLLGTDMNTAVASGSATFFVAIAAILGLIGLFRT